MKKIFLGLSLLFTVSVFSVEPSQFIDMKHGETIKIAVIDCSPGEQPTYTSEAGKITAYCEATECQISSDEVQNRYKRDSNRVYNTIYLPLAKQYLQVEMKGRAAAVVKGQNLVAEGHCSDYSVNWFGDRRKH